MGVLVLGRFHARLIRSVRYGLVSALLLMVAGSASLPVAPAQAATTAAAGEYVPLPPVPIIDARFGLGGRSTA
jgi:hypothetical protein